MAMETEREQTSKHEEVHLRCCSCPVYPCILNKNTFFNVSATLKGQRVASLLDKICKYFLLVSNIGQSL